ARCGEPPPGTGAADRCHLCRPATPRAARPWPAADGALRLHVLRGPATGRSRRAATARLPPAPHRLGQSRPEVNQRWSDTASAHDERGLKHRAVTETRRVPIPPELGAILRQHTETFGTAPDGRIFASERGHVVASTASATSGPKRVRSH